MGAYHRRKKKEYLGHADFGPVLGSDSLVTTNSIANTIVGHTVAYTWVAPRTTDVKGIVVQSTGNVAVGRINYALVCGGTVALSGDLPVGSRSECDWVQFPRANAVVVASGTIIEVAYAVPASIGTAQSVRFAVPVNYVGNQ